MKKIHHVKSATQENYNMKEWNMKKVQHGNNVTWARYNIKRVQHEKSATWKSNKSEILKKKFTRIVH